MYVAELGLRLVRDDHFEDDRTFAH